MSSGGAYSPGVGSSAAGGAYSPGVSGNSGSNSGNGCSGSCFDPSQLKYQYLQGYFGAHMLPAPSYRYVYLLWFITIVVSLVLGAFHMLGVGDRSYIGAKWKRWATKNRVYKIGKRVDIHGNPIRKDREGFSTAPLKPRKMLTFPSFGRLVLAFFMLAVPIVLTLVGADFIGPNVGVFDFSQSWPQQTTNIVGLSRRAAQLFPRSVQWGQGSYPSVTTYPPSRTLPYRTWWTSGDRTGDITMGLVPIVLIMALKQVPFALLSTRFFGGYSFDRLSFLHKWGGRIIWLFGTAHLVTWCIQLNKDTRIGESVLSFAFMWTKFRWGWVSYGFLTAMTVLSIGPIRNRFYEWFYITHVVTVAGFIITAMLHHPPLAQWMYIPLAWWVAERLSRALKVAWINGLGFAGRKPQFALAPKSQRLPSQSGTWPDGSYRHQQRQATPSHDPSYQRPPYHAQPHNSLQRDHMEYAVAYRPQTSVDTSMRSHGTVASSYSSHKIASEYEPTLVDSAPEGERRKAGSPPVSEKMVEPLASEMPHPLARQGDPSPERREVGVERRVTRPSARYDPVNDLIQDYIPSRHSNADIYPPPPIEALPSLPQQYAANKHGYRELDYALQEASGPVRSATPYDIAHPYPPHYARERSHSTAISAISERPSTVFSMPPSALPRQLRPRPAMPADVAAVIRPGYAFVQLLPGKTLRLTLRTPNKMSWKPGQWVYLNIPSVRFWESHPFTIASAHDADFPVATEFVDADEEKGLANAQKAKGEERTMVLLVRCRQGFTRHLWNHVQEKRRLQIQAAADAQHGASVYGIPGTSAVPAIGKDTTGVHIRAIVDGPYGSADRTHWKIHSSVVIICGGSGVTFGMSVLEHLCACMLGAMKLGKDGKGGKNFLTKRVRFVWIMREYSHLQWIASALRRCIEMVPPEHLQVDLYVTHFNHQSALLGGARNGSHGLSQRDRGGPNGDGRLGTASSADSYLRAARFTEGPEQDDLDLTAYDLTHFDGEDQSAPTALESRNHL